MNPSTASTPQTVSRQAQNTITLFATALALFQTGFGIGMPVFAKQMDQLGAGVAGLGYLTTAFAAGQLIFAPIMGSLADRFGRRPFALLAMLAMLLANLIYPYIENVTLMVLVRFLQGALGAGLMPAAMGAVGDLIPEKERARWAGIVMGGFAFGFIFGPTLGGVLYDRFGLFAPFFVSAGLAALTLILALFRLPETHRKATTAAQKVAAAQPVRFTPFLLLLLTLDFFNTFVFSFVEPQMILHFYNDLGWSATVFGIIVGVYGIVTAAGQAFLGQLSDRFGRMPIIVLGFVLSIPLYLMLLLSSSIPMMVVAAIFAGLGAALIAPALSAAYLDLTTDHDRARVMGFKQSASAIGMVAGPLLVAVLSEPLQGSGVFLVGTILSGIAALLALMNTLRRKPALAMGD